MLGRRDKAKGLEAEVQSLEVRRSGVLNRLADAVTRHDAAVAEQRRFLTETDGADARQARSVAENSRKAADERAALEDAARTLAELIEDAKARLAAERDRRERDRTAGEIEAGAVRIEEAAARMDEAAAAFDRANIALVQACRDHAPRDPILGSGPEGNILAAAGRLAGILPRENPFEGVAGYERPIGAVPAAAVTVSAMRANARAIREGAAPNVLPSKPPEPTQPAIFPEVQVVLSRPAFYRTYLGQRIDVPAGGLMLPEPIAAQAMNLGVGFGPQSMPGAAIMRILRINPAARIEPDESGSFRGVAFTGALGDGGKGMKPAEPPADLGALPDMHGVILSEAAQ
ncbi:hypothetical protein ASG32_24220 [Methylobacterium sp. Leaf361]|nr:hypothetical protein ASG32_24220 [Methylobacterium sp. Leaf361]